MSTTSDVIFEGGQGINKINFTPDGNYCITGGKPLSTNVDPNDAQKIKVTVTADRNGSDECVDSFRRAFGGDKVNTIHTRGGDARPKDLNFWISGTLTINGNVKSTYSVVLAQGHAPTYNNWFMGSRSISADNDNKSGTLMLAGDDKNPKYRITTSGSNTFKLSQIV